jgi:hypothetical protein
MRIEAQVNQAMISLSRPLISFLQLSHLWTGIGKKKGEFLSRHTHPFGAPAERLIEPLGDLRRSP